jgi:TetR/AcrR family transcriptional regulator, tetracycline repressor protein
LSTVVTRTQPAGRPKEKLSREAVARAALALTDSEGLDALTIRRLATTLEVTPMALYWHFKDKEALLDGVAEAVLAEMHLPEAGGSAAWDDELRALLDALLGVLAAHPAVSEVLKTRILLNDPGREVTERVLGALRAGGFSAEQASQTAVYALHLLASLVIGLPGQAIGQTEEEREQQVRTKWAALQALSPKQFPNIIDCAASLTDCAESDEWFTLGMDTLMSGIRARAAVL